MKPQLFALLCFTGLTGGSFAQVSVTNDVHVSIVSPIGISNSEALVFGNLNLTPFAKGSITMTINGDRITGNAGEHSLTDTTGTFTAAKFSITGMTDYVYSVTLPSGIAVLAEHGFKTMTVDTWTCNQQSDNFAVSIPGDIYIGGTLHVDSGPEMDGTNANAEFRIIVNYN